MYALSVLFHVSQFYFPSDFAKSIENQSLQLLSNGPRNATPSDLIGKLDSLGFKTGAREFECVARAAMFRAATTSSAFHQAVKRLSEFALSDECQITHAWNELWKNSITISTWRNYDLMNQIPRVPVFGDRRFQRKAERALLRRRKYSPHQFLHDRLRHCTPETSRADVDQVFRFLLRVAKVVPFFLVSSCFKTVSNAWCTSGRFRGPNRDCPFCLVLCQDTFMHVICCEVLARSVRSRLPFLPNVVEDARNV
eukprot:8939423-Pyramimonas_sp.AAC.1